PATLAQPASHEKCRGERQGTYRVQDDRELVVQRSFKWPLRIALRHGERNETVEEDRSEERRPDDPLNSHSAAEFILSVGGLEGWERCLKAGEQLLHRRSLAPAPRALPRSG